MVGDSIVDIEFARRLGMTAIPIDNNSPQAGPAINALRSWPTSAFRHSAKP